MTRWIDLPPVWLLVFLGLARVQTVRLPVGGSGAWSDFAGGVLVGGGVLLMGLAVAEMRRQRTTVIPHETPSMLVQTGIFRRSRNPIYLGDTLVLAGFVLFWGAWPSLLLVPLFMWLVTDRFIAPEEARMEETFGAAFDAYRAKVRRWV